MYASMSSHEDDVLQYFSPKEGEVVIDVGAALDELRYEVAVDCCCISICGINYRKCRQP